MHMPTRNEIKCPICGSKMGELGNPDTPTLSSTLVYTVKSDRQFARTVIYMCSKCRNIQSFIAELPQSN
jgi:DNA-directed RNA polymerase subunit RPC12/RpoP